MDEAELLIRHKLTSKVPTSNKQKAEGIHTGTGARHAFIQETADTLKYRFVTDGLHFVGYLLDEVLRQSGVSSDIVKCLAAFDPSFFSSVSRLSSHVHG